MNTLPIRGQLCDSNLSPWRMRVRVEKRLIDITGSLLALIVLAPVFFVLAILIRVVSPGPVFFHQLRIGFRGQPFRCHKFRTMRYGTSQAVHRRHCDTIIRTNGPMEKLDSTGDDRLIPCGRFLRASGLDELPQLINILCGEMSFVGPRPCLLSEYAYYSQTQRLRFEVLPGLTGLWQVSGKNETTFSRMIELDTDYVAHISLGTDLKIMARTPAVLAHQIAQLRRKTNSACRKVHGRRSGHTGVVSKS